MVSFKSSTMHAVNEGWSRQLRNRRWNQSWPLVMPRRTCMWYWSCETYMKTKWYPWSFLHNKSYSSCFKTGIAIMHNGWGVFSSQGVECLDVTKDYLSFHGHLTLRAWCFNWALEFSSTLADLVSATNCFRSSVSDKLAIGVCNPHNPRLCPCASQRPVHESEFSKLFSGFFSSDYIMLNSRSRWSVFPKSCNLSTSPSCRTTTACREARLMKLYLLDAEGWLVTLCRTCSMRDESLWNCMCCGWCPTFGAWSLTSKLPTLWMAKLCRGDHNPTRHYERINSCNSAGFRLKSAFLQLSLPFFQRTVGQLMLSVTKSLKVPM